MYTRRVAALSSPLSTSVHRYTLLYIYVLVYHFSSLLNENNNNNHHRAAHHFCTTTPLSGGRTCVRLYVRIYIRACARQVYIYLCLSSQSAAAPCATSSCGQSIALSPRTRLLLLLALLVSSRTSPLHHQQHYIYLFIYIIYMYTRIYAGTHTHTLLMQQQAAVSGARERRTRALSLSLSFSPLLRAWPLRALLSLSAPPRRALRRSLSSSAAAAAAASSAFPRVRMRSSAMGERLRERISTLFRVVGVRWPRAAFLLLLYICRVVCACVYVYTGVDLHSAVTMWMQYAWVCMCMQWLNEASFSEMQCIYSALRVEGGRATELF